MQTFRADLHIHSRFSRATSSRLNPYLLAAWAGIKGLDILGTGDFTHPKWREELAEIMTLEEETGLYVLKNPAGIEEFMPEWRSPAAFPPQPVRFMPQAEISSIYKRHGKVRKVHNLIFMPTLEAAAAFSLKLEQVGNLHSDGRPILGLDSRNLLEMVLEAHPQAFMVPAHIWTPWFSLFGSKSGFDSMEECFGDLAGHIFALETGLSSDPPMNRLVSGLDQYRLISNSDAHSGENLGREANIFAGAMTYEGMLEALKNKPDFTGPTRFLGTLEFFPEEGKYHMDGHRACKVVLFPEESKRLNNICPVCGKPLTVGVLHRVMDLADRAEPVLPVGEECRFLIPLPELLGEILGCGSKTRKVTDMYARALERFGSEMAILQDTPLDDLARFFPPLGEGIGRMRAGEVIRHGGYDGQYGVVRVFTEQEQADIARGTGITRPRKGGSGKIKGLTLLDGLPVPEEKGRKKRKGKTQEADVKADAKAEAETGAETEVQADRPDPDEDFAFSPISAPDEDPDGDSAGSQGKNDGKDEGDGKGEGEGDDGPGRLPLKAPAGPEGLNPGQERAVLAGPGPVLVLAGPGTGKTRTLIARILHLLDEGISSRRILAVTFTRRAASEMDSRLSAILNPDNGEKAALPRTDTLHALALELWHKVHSDVPVLLSEESARNVFREANATESPQALRDAWDAISLARERLEEPPPKYAEIALNYFKQKAAWNLADYTDLLEFWREQIVSGLFTSPWDHVLVDEVQDLSPLQLMLVSALLNSSGEGFFGIGDPDQSIYGFRGAHGHCEEYFKSVWPGLSVIPLAVNYRSRPGVMKGAAAVLGPPGLRPPLETFRQSQANLHIFEALSAETEAAWVADRVRALVGSSSHTLADASSDTAASEEDGTYSPGDIAILVRTHSLARPLRRALLLTGLPIAEPQQDVFWAEPRVALILNAAGRMLGVAAPEPLPDAPDPLSPETCPEKVLAKGPLGVAAYFNTIPPFDVLFWKSKAFRALVKAYDAHGGWSQVITWINLQNEMELARAKSEKIQILSLHAAKGLEFRAVFMPCLEDGLVPFAGVEFLTGKAEKGSGPDLEEERRLFYVGLTRAKDALYLSFAARRRLYGREIRLKPSRFLESLPKDLFTRTALVTKLDHKESHLSLF